MTGPGAQHKVKPLTERTAASKICQQHAAGGFQRLLLYAGSPTPNDFIVPPIFISSSFAARRIPHLTLGCARATYAKMQETTPNLRVRTGNLCQDARDQPVPLPSFLSSGPATNNQYGNAQVHTSAPGGYKIPQPRAAENHFSRIHLSTWEVQIKIPMPRAAETASPESTFSELRCVIVLQLLPLIFVHGMQYPVARIVILKTSEK